MAEQEIGRHEYNAYKLSVDYRLGQLEKNMDTAMGDIKKLPSREEIKKDLDHQTIILTGSITNLQNGIAAEKERDKDAAVKWRWVIGIAAPFAIVLLNIIAKKMGWL